MSSTSDSTSEALPARSETPVTRAAVIDDRDVMELWGPSGCLARRCHVRSRTIGRIVGLLGSAGLDDDEAMLITRCRSVHTLGMRFAIDVVFVDRALEVLALQAGIAPWRSPRGVRRARHVIEAGAGAIARWGIAKGDRLDLRPVRDG